MTGRVEAALAERGLTLPQVVPPLAAYQPPCGPARTCAPRASCPWWTGSSRSPARSAPRSPPRRRGPRAHLRAERAGRGEVGRGRPGPHRARGEGGRLRRVGRGLHRAARRAERRERAAGRDPLATGACTPAAPWAWPYCRWTRRSRWSSRRSCCRTRTDGQAAGAVGEPCGVPEQQDHRPEPAAHPPAGRAADSVRDRVCGQVCGRVCGPRRARSAARCAGPRRASAGLGWPGRSAECARWASAGCVGRAHAPTDGNRRAVPVGGPRGGKPAGRLPCCSVPPRRASRGAAGGSLYGPLFPAPVDPHRLRPCLTVSPMVSGTRRNGPASSAPSRPAS